jgi:uncharacterized protein
MLPARHDSCSAKVERFQQASEKGCAVSSALASRIDLVVIQPTPFCNIDCRYCYLAGRGSRQVIEDQTLAKIYERLFASAYLGESVTLLWHAGEPLTVPISFYQKAFALLDRHNLEHIPVLQQIQTNATLISQPWCDFFKAHNVDVSVSIDGPKHLHDANRLTRSGRGTFERAMRGVRLLQANGIPIHNIAVLTSESLDHPEEIWEFFVSHRFARLAFNVEETEGAHDQSSLNHAGAVARYRAFFRRLRQLRKTSGRNIWIRELDDMQQRIRWFSSELESTLNQPLATLNFDCEGNISTFSPELLTVHNSKYHNFKFGNVFSCGVDDILRNPQFRTAHHEIQNGIARCRATCPYFSVCGGGEPSTKLAENGTFDSTETMHCRLIIQALCDVVLEDVEETLGIGSQTCSRSLETCAEPPLGTC